MKKDKPPKPPNDKPPKPPKPPNDKPPKPPDQPPDHKPPKPPEPPWPPNESDRVLLLKILDLQKQTLASQETFNQLQQELNTLVLENLTISRHISSEIEEIDENVEKIDDNVEEILRIVKEILILVTPPEITGFTLQQILKEISMPILGVQVGASADFTIGFVPPNGRPLQSGPTATSDDPLVVLSPVGTNNIFTATVDATDTNTAFNVTVSGVNGKGDTITAVFSIPILSAPPVDITDFTLDQNLPSSGPAPGIPLPK